MASVGSDGFAVIAVEHLATMVPSVPLGQQGVEEAFGMPFEVVEALKVVEVVVDFDKVEVLFGMVQIAMYWQYWMSAFHYLDS